MDSASKEPAGLFDPANARADASRIHRVTLTKRSRGI
ncbi:hypothetical protein EZJ58_0866 [Sodalis ligni]|jgi:hypothetical protein|uniref:Uncharacterized protein n=1 Tax=Sodalis ligni TaxID=2697027 RepID=A0A4R1N8C4_9GAMM|nr:hypothetical protein EZJ58_0866 [Sodalis ligni]